MEKKSSVNTMIRFSPALGIIFGSAIGSVAGLLTNNNLALTAGMGAGLGLLVGTIVYTFAIGKTK